MRLTGVASLSLHGAKLWQCSLISGKNDHCHSCFILLSVTKQPSLFLDIIRQWSSIFNMNHFSLLGSLLDSNYKEFFGFLTFGTVVYFGYGIRHSALNSPTNTNKKKHNRPEQKTSPSGVCLSPSNTNVKKKDCFIFMIVDAGKNS